MDDDTTITDAAGGCYFPKRHYKQLNRGYSLPQQGRQKSPPLSVRIETSTPQVRYHLSQLL